MHLPFSSLPRALASAALLASMALPGAHAQTGSAAAERARCDGVQQDTAACEREAGAARQEAQRGGLAAPGADTYGRNALERCRSQPAADRADCEARVRGGGSSSTEGSVMGGGVIRETVTPVPASKP